MKNKTDTWILLRKYSHFSLAFLLMNKSVDADVVYTDIEPDIILSNDSDNYFLDLNDDSYNDFRFFNKSFAIGGYWTSGSIYYIPFNNFERIIGTALFDNSFAANTVDYGKTFSTLIRTLPFALNSGVVINESLTFQPNYQQLLAFKTELDLAGELYYFGGHWFPEEIDHYLGVKFQDSDLEVHYGWVRCDIKESGRILIIKDYAYETEIEHPIVAGDTLSYLGVDNTQNMLDAIVYSSEKSIYIHLPSNNETFISILDITGKELVKKELQNCSEIINMSIFPYGLYLVNITQNDKSMIKRVLIQ